MEIAQDDSEQANNWDQDQWGYVNNSDQEWGRVNNWDQDEWGQAKNWNDDGNEEKQILQPASVHYTSVPVMDEAEWSDGWK